MKKAFINPLLLLLLLAPVVAPAQRPTFSLETRPTPALKHLKNIIGEYLAEGTTLLVFEEAGALFVARNGQSPERLTEAGFREYLHNAENPGKRSEVFFEGKPGSRPVYLEWNDIRYDRKPFDGEDGKTFTITPLFRFDELQRRARRATPPAEEGEFRRTNLVELKPLDSTIHYDIRYATTNNFLRMKLYTRAHAYLQRPAAQAFVRAHRWLEQFGYGLLVHDAYRPWKVTKMFWDATPWDMKEYVANPANGSRHNRGCAVDVTLFDRKTGEPIEMVSGYDEFSERADPDYRGGTSLQRWHRALLREALEREGFIVYRSEWWHFDYGDWRRYRIEDVSFEVLEGR